MNRLKEFEENLQKAQNSLINIIAHKIINKSDAFDIFQRASVTMWKKYDSFDGDTNFMAWASTIALYEVKNYVRSCIRCPVTFNSEIFHDVSSSLKNPIKENNNEIYDKLNKALSKLDSVSKRILTLVYVDNIEIKELAKKDGKSPQTYYNKLTIARKKLLSYLNA